MQRRRQEYGRVAVGQIAKHACNFWPQSNDIRKKSLKSKVFKHAFLTSPPGLIPQQNPTVASARRTQTSTKRGEMHTVQPKPRTTTRISESNSPESSASTPFNILTSAYLIRLCCGTMLFDAVDIDQVWPIWLCGRLSMWHATFIRSFRSPRTKTPSPSVNENKKKNSAPMKNGRSVTGRTA